MKPSVSILAVVVTAALCGCNDGKKDEKAAPSASAKPAPAAKATAEPEAEAKPTKPAKTAGVKVADLKPADNKQIVENLNEICPDTHCEGEFNWEFKTFACEEKKCTLSFVATGHTNKKKHEDKITFEYDGEVLDADRVETDTFTEKLNEAILGWETKHR